MLAEDYYTCEFLRQAKTFEALKTIIHANASTERDMAMVQVCKELAAVCRMLAEVRTEEVEGRGGKSR